MTAVEWLVEQLVVMDKQLDGRRKNEDATVMKMNPTKIVEQAKEMEKENTDNKVIHFAEWLTKKHTLTLMALYEQFEEEFYNE